MPHFYIYTIANVGEGVIAKRRSYAGLQSYLTPPFMESGVKNVYKPVSQTLAEGLTDKFTTILAGKNPTDNYHNSLCWQPNPSANRVLFVTFDKSHSVIAVGQEEIDYANERNGIRCPVG